MNKQFKFTKQVITSSFYWDINPEQLVMMQIQESMKAKKMRSYKSYLKWIDTDRIQRTDISMREIAELLNISLREADNLAVHWMNTIGGQVTYCANIAAYYFKGVYEIVN